MLQQWGSIVNISGINYSVSTKDIIYPITFLNTCTCALASISNLHVIVRTASFTNGRVTFSFFNDDNVSTADLFTWIAIGF